MSKNDPTDKSTYTFARLSLGKFGHGKITFNTDAMTECPHCKKQYNFGREKVLCLEPRFKNKYIDKATGEKQQDYFYLEWEINTPSKRDPYPRISYILKACKLTVEDKKWDSDTITDTVTLRTHEEEGYQMKILEMVEEDEGDYSNCCGAPFGYPGWPDCDICSACGEHAEPEKE